MADNPQPRLRLSHSTIAARDLDAMVDFYTDVLGFVVTNRGLAGPDGPELAFMSQDPSEHHQMVFISAEGTRPPYLPPAGRHGAICGERRPCANLPTPAGAPRRRLILFRP